MVDVEIRPPGGLSTTPSHAAALRRFSARAAAHYYYSPTLPSPNYPAFANGTYYSYTPLAEAIISHLKSAGVRVLPGLTAQEFASAEAEFGVVFPPDLRAVLSLGLPDAPGFPDWRSPSARPLVRSALRLPSAAVSLLVSRRAFWHPAWGPRPADGAAALRQARAALHRAPPLIPLVGRYYLPSHPSLPGNPVLLVDDARGVSAAAPDLAAFFRSRSALGRLPPVVSPPPPRWVEFWTDAASTGDNSGRRRRRSSASSCSSTSSAASSSSSAEEYVEIRAAKSPAWVGEYLESIGEVLRGGGWGEEEVREVVEVPPASGDKLAVREEILLKADGMSESLRRAGWTTEDIADSLGFGFGFEPEPNPRGRRKDILLPLSIAKRLGELAYAVSLPKQNYTAMVDRRSEK